MSAPQPKDQPISEVDELDRLFNMAINAKRIAIDTVMEADEFGMLEKSEIAEKGNVILEQYRDKFKADVTALLHKAEVRGYEKGAQKYRIAALQSLPESTGEGK